MAAPLEQREAIVRASDQPREVQDQVLELLEASESSDGFLEPATWLQPGAQVGAYRIERILGRGGMGVVYLARDTRLQRLAALKALPPHLFHDDRMRARLRQEARAAAALSHPSIATVFALEEMNGAVFIASEYVEGRTLRDELNAGPLERARALAIARDVAGALAAAHDRGIVHRDLKPENIIVMRSGAVKLVDFGLAQFDVAADDLAAVSRLTQTGTVAGTPPYMAPEQLLGHRTDGRTDQFSFGVLLYELLTGRHAFGSGPLPSTIAKVLSAEIDRAGLDDAMWAIISRATQKRPDDRFPSMGALLEALDAGPGARRPSSHTDTSAATGVTPVPPVTLVTDAGGAPERSWWEVHQLVVALAYFGMLWPAWHVHKWTGPYGVPLFLATLAIVVVGGVTRLHLWFTSLSLPRQLAVQRARLAPLVHVADAGFVLTMLLFGSTIAGDHTGWGALFVSFGIGAAIAALIIEPTTARDTFPRADYS